MNDFIYLRRGNDIAVLQDPAKLPAYEAAGWETIDADTYHGHSREKSLLARAQAEVAAAQRARQAVIVAWADGCPVCKSAEVVRPVGAPPWCRSCKRHATW